MMHGTYVGIRKGLNGKEAMLQVKEDIVLAQFDDIGTGMGYNWYEFPISDWDIDERPLEMA